jgi:hypothetical protein
MSHARQSRRLARTWAETLGSASGVAAVEDWVFQSELADVEVTARELLSTIAPGTIGWDEPAINADAARYDRCPRGSEHLYYVAYERAAVARVRELVAELTS